MTIRWSKEARSDVEAIHAFIARDSLNYAKSFSARLLASVEHLASFPLSGRQVTGFEREGARETFFGSYRILYAVRETEVEILTVVHGSRHLPGISKAKQ